MTNLDQRLQFFENRCSSLEDFNPEFKVWFNSFIFKAFLNKQTFHLLCLSIIFALLFTKLMQVDVKSGSLSLLRKIDDIHNDECNKAIPNRRFTSDQSLLFVTLLGYKNHTLIGRWYIIKCLFNFLYYILPRAANSKSLTSRILGCLHTSKIIRG